MSLTDEAELKDLREVLDSDEEYYMEYWDAEREDSYSSCGEITARLLDKGLLYFS